MLFIQPRAGRVVVERRAASSETTGGILLPDISMRRPLEAIVIAVGPEVTDLKKGDDVLFSQFAGMEIVDRGRKLLVLDEKEVLATLYRTKEEG